MKIIFRTFVIILLGLGIALAQNVDKRCADIDRQYQEALQKMKGADEHQKMTVIFDREDVNFGLVEKRLVFYYDNTQEEVNSNRLYLVRTERRIPQSSVQETIDYLFDPAYPLGRFILMNKDFSSSDYRIEERAYSDGKKPFLMRSRQIELPAGKVVNDATQTKDIEDLDVKKHKVLLKIFNGIANPE
ncbi:MAG: hypothetical protein IKI30_03855 [Oxalobacter sp.]|nr:hypothetical protein [Oxalobacter sp.]